MSKIDVVRTHAESMNIYDTIKEFGKYTGIPILINTSCARRTTLTFA